MLVVRLRLSTWPRDRSGSAELAGYVLIALMVFGLRLLIEPGKHYFGFRADPKSFIWCFGWWPFAILHGENPFVSHLIWAPSGVNLTWTASVPGLALLFAPLTLLVGPVASYNVAATFLPAVAAWTCFLLCRHLTRRLGPSLVGGYLFGFSSYVLGQEEGHLNVSAVFLVPLIVLVIVRFVESDLTARGLVLRLGPLCGLEVLISTEVSFTIALAVGLGIVLALALVPERREALVRLLAPLAGASLFAALLTAPFVYYAVTGFRAGAFQPPEGYVTDVLNFVVPTKLSLASLGWAASISDKFPGNSAERGGYLGVPSLLIVALYARARARSPTGRFLLAALAVAVVCSLGAQLTIEGRHIIALPWSAVGDWPVFDNVLAERLAMYVSLLAAVIVALWTAARPPGVMRWLLPALAVIAVIPNPAAGVWASRYAVPAFFTASTYRTCLDPNEIILPLPVTTSGESMLWQAVDGYRFRMAGGYIAATPPAAFLRPRDVALITAGHAIPARDSGVFAVYIRDKQVASVVVDRRLGAFWEGALDRIAMPKVLGGVVLYHVAGKPASCR